MVLYSFKAADKQGKIINDTIEAEDERAAAALVHSKGWIPIRIKPAGKGKDLLRMDVKTGFRAFLNRVSGKDLMLFTQDLATLLESGLPVDRALSILVDTSENKKMKETARDILKIVEGGGYLSDAFAKYPGIFPKLYVNMIRAGEAGGVLEPVLERIGAFLETSQELKDYIKSALIYPIFLVCVGGLSIIILMTYVIPKFSVIFSDMGGTMPMSTRMLMAVSGGVRQYWWAIAGVVVFIWVAVRRYSASEKGRARLDHYKLNMPLTRAFVQKLEVARFARTLGTLIRSGVPILKSMELVKDVVGNSAVASALVNVRTRVKEGERLSVPLSDAGVFPPLAIQMITVGEETGRLEEMLLRVAESYEKTIKNMVKRLIGLLEPAMILIMGIIVAFIVISMLMAIFSMNDMPF